MPLYEYHCQDCDDDFEKMMRFSEADSHPECPKCGSRETHKQISTIAVRSVSSSGSTVASSSCGTGGRFS